MARIYKRTALRRLINWVVAALVRVGATRGSTYLLTVPGRRSGVVHTTPVRLIENSEQRWLVAPYGEVNWVRNARAAGKVTLTRGRRSEEVQVVEVGPDEAAPVLKQYATEVPITRPFFVAKPESPVDTFAREVASHPVFRLARPEAMAS